MVSLCNNVQKIVYRGVDVIYEESIPNSCSNPRDLIPQSLYPKRLNEMVICLYILLSFFNWHATLPRLHTLLQTFTSIP